MVKQKGEKRLSSGVPGFDKLIEGGFEKGTINVVAGSSGSGKTIFAMQFLIEGLKKGEKCIFVSFEEKKEKFYNNMVDFGWNLQEYEKKGNFFFLEYTPDKVRSMIEEGGGEIEGIILKNKISRLAIDTITSFELLFDEELEKKESAKNLFDIIKKWGVTAILTMNKSSKKKKDEGSLESEVDSVTAIYFLRKGNKRERRVEILKMRGTNHSTKMHKIEVAKSGFNISN